LRHRRLDQFLHRLDKARCIPAVDHAVVAADRDVHQLALGNAFAAQAIGHEHRPLDNAVGANDRHFRPVDHRRRRHAAQRPERGNGEGGAGQFIRLGRAVARGIGEAGDFARQGPRVHRLRIADHRHHQARRGLRRHAQVHRAVARHHAGFIVIAGVEHGELRQRAADRHDQQRQHGQARTIETAGVELRAQFLQRGDIAFLDIGKMRDRALGRGHVLGNAAAQADHLDLLIRARRTAWGIAAVIGQELVQVAMAQTPILRRAHLGQVDPQFPGALAHRRAGKHAGALVPSGRVCANGSRLFWHHLRSG